VHNVVVAEPRIAMTPQEIDDEALKARPGGRAEGQHADHDRMVLGGSFAASAGSSSSASAAGTCNVEVRFKVLNAKDRTVVASSRVLKVLTLAMD
jgi:hypothetical protein